MGTIQQVAAGWATALNGPIMFFIGALLSGGFCFAAGYKLGRYERSTR